jgi:hypothetical protein
MTIPLDMTVVFFTFEQMGEVADVADGVSAAERLADDDPAMDIPAMEPLDVADEDPLFVAGCDVASASETAPSTSTAAVATDTAPVHQTRPAIPMVDHLSAIRLLRSPMPCSPLGVPTESLAPTCVPPVRSALGECDDPYRRS